MATSDSFPEPYTGRPKFQLRVGVSRDAVDTPNNQSRWDYYLRVENDDSGTDTWSDYRPDYSITIEGKVVASGVVPVDTFDFRDGEDYHVIKTGTTGWIKHDSSGNLTLNVAAQTDSIPTFGSASPSGSLKANRILRGPSAPGVPVVTNVTATGATITWKAPSSSGSSPVNNYDLDIAKNSAFSPEGDRDPGNKLSMTVNDLTPNTKYWVRVRAFNDDAGGPYSPVAPAEVTFTTKSAGNPTLNSVTSGLSGADATVVMSPPSGATAVTSFTIENRLMPNGPWVKVASGSPNRTQVVGGLTPGATYQWRVLALLNTTPTGYSNTVEEEQERRAVASGGYFDGGFPDTSDQRYDWLVPGSPHNSVSTANGYPPTGWMSFDAGRTVSGGTGSVVRLPDPWVGDRAAVASFMTDASGAGFVMGTSAAAPGRADILADRPYTASAYVKVSRPQRMALQIGWLTTAGGLIDVAEGEPQLIPANIWTRLSATGVSPDAADFAQVRVTDVVGDGWAVFHSGDVITMDGVMLGIGDELLPYFDGSFPDDALYQYAWLDSANPHASVSVRTDHEPVQKDPLADPDCVVVPAPPRPPQIADECIDDTALWLRFWSEIPAVEISDWLTVVPTFVLQTYGYVVRQVRIRVYANPFNFPIGVADTANWCSEQIVSYIPGQTVLTLDGPLQRAFAEVEGGAPLPADHLLYGTGGTPASWPELSCGINYLVSYDIPVDVNVPADTAPDAFRPLVYLTTRM